MSLALFLLGARRVGTAVITWLSHRSFWQLVSLALCAALLVQHLALRSERRHGEKVEAQLGKVIEARKADRAAYIKAQSDAAAKNQAQVAKVEQQYQRNSDATKDAYARDHAELVRLRQQRAAAAKGSASGTGPSPDHSARPGPDGDGVQVPPADDVQKTRDDAADIELRLMHLQNYVEGLLKINPNK